MSTWRLGLPIAMLCVAGCPLLPINLTGGDGQTLSIAELFSAALAPPPVGSGQVRVRIVNASETDADTRITMRISGVRVHFTERLAPANSSTLVIGPDRAETILFEATRLGAIPESIPMQLLQLGTDFLPGQTVVVTIPPLPDDDPGRPAPDDGSDDEPPPEEEPEPPTLGIENRDDDIRVNPGTPVAFDVVTANASAEARVRVFADPDADPDNGNELVIAEDLAAADRVPVVWDTTHVSIGLYLIYAELRDGAVFVRVGPAPGTVRINALPALMLDSPLDGLLVTIGRTFRIGWAGQDDDDDAKITILLDPNPDVADDERVLRTDISENDVSDRDLEVDTSTLSPGTYVVLGVIEDGLNVVEVVGPRVCLTRRNAGRVSPTQLGLGEITTISGGADNRALGASLDVSRDLNGDSYPDLLLGDPLAFDGAGKAPVQTGIVYYHEAAAWPRNLNADELDLNIIGVGPGSQTGARVAIVESIDQSNPFGELLIGAPTYSVEGGPDGRAYLLDGKDARRLSTIRLDSLGGPGPLRAAVFSGFGQRVGLDVAALGDINRDGHADFGIGATANFNDFNGFVGFVGGGAFPPSARLDNAGFAFDGGIAAGAPDTALTGYSIRGVPDMNGDEADEVLIGAPGIPAAGPRSGAGVVYLLYGGSSLIETCGGECENGFTPLEDVGSSVPGHVFVGENPGDFAGFALAAGDFDGDNLPDLLIGAPGFDEARGRVYLIRGNQELPPIVNLADVGTLVDGAVFDGVSIGDQLGFAVANAGDFDHDNHDDLLLGAPGTASSAGAALLIYGGQGLSGSVSLLPLGTCDFPGLLLSGENAGGRLGAALSGGPNSGPALAPVIGVGAPGSEGVSGEAHLLFGIGKQIENREPEPRDPL